MLPFKNFPCDDDPACVWPIANIEGVDDRTSRAVYAVSIVVAVFVAAV